MLYACHSLYQNLYAWIRIGSRGSIGVSSHPAQEGSRRLLSSHALGPGISPAKAAWIGRGCPLAKDFTLRPNTQVRIFRIASMA